MAKLSKTESRRRWFAQAQRVVCAPCQGKKRPDRLGGSVMQTPLVCPACGRAWVYRVNGELPEAKRTVFWHYVPDMEPFPRG